MRIVHIITRMIVGGAQENTLYNCVDLVRHYGDDVTLVTGPSEGAEGKLLQAHDTSLLKLRTVPSLTRNIHPIHDLRALGQLKRIIREIKPEVVHTHSAKGGMLGRAAAWSLRVPCVIHTVHGAPFHPYQSPASRTLFQMCERWAAKRCHKMICVADAMTDLMVQAHVASREMFQTIYSGMEVEPFLGSDRHRIAMRRELGFSDQDIVIGKIARLFHLKGHEYVIDAAKRLGDQGANIKFLFVGDGILRGELEERIRSAGLRDRFVFMGLVSPSDIPKALGAMDALVHTSLREGLARALPQALIAGKPVISFDIDGAREVVINDQTGYLIAPKDIESLSAALSKIGADKELRQRLGAKGRERFTEQFRHETMTSKIRSLYEAILANETNR